MATYKTNGSIQEVEYQVQTVDPGTDQLKLYKEFITHQIAAFGYLFQIITGKKPPKLKELLRM